MNEKMNVTSLIFQPGPFRYSVLGRQVVVVSDPATLPAVLGSDAFAKSPLAALGEGTLSKEAHAGLASAFGPEGAKCAPSPTPSPPRTCSTALVFCRAEWVCRCGTPLGLSMQRDDML
jgi:hypothetical protein